MLMTLFGLILILGGLLLFIVGLVAIIKGKISFTSRFTLSGSNARWAGGGLIVLGILMQILWQTIISG
jgi:hypothetical protein